MPSYMHMQLIKVILNAARVFLSVRNQDVDDFDKCNPSSISTGLFRISTLIFILTSTGLTEDFVSVFLGLIGKGTPSATEVHSHFSLDCCTHAARLSSLAACAIIGSLCLSPPLFPLSRSHRRRRLSVTRRVADLGSV